MKPANPLLALLPLALVIFSGATAIPQDIAAVPCGTLGLPSCPYGQTCINNPAKPGCSIAADCPGICATLDGPTCGGWLLTLCPDYDHQTCVDDPRDDCDPEHGGADCPGICVNLGGSTVDQGYPKCVGVGGLACPQVDQICAEDPRNCEEGMTDCFGICVGPELSACGGFAGLLCPAAGQICVDDPRDDCDPKAGAADCLGICV